MDGDHWQSVIEQKAFADDANATGYGNLTFAPYPTSGCANETAVLIAGGGTPGGYFDNIDYKAFESNANAVSVGALSQSKSMCNGASGNA